MQVLYIDDGDGNRVSDQAACKLAEVGLELRLDDAMPDILLMDRAKSAFWVIEAVTSDGEVDLHKVVQVTKLIHRGSPNAVVGFTTAYRTWKDAAARQARFKNLAPGSFLWILEDPSKQFHVEVFD